MERRVLFSIFLSFLVIYAWQALFLNPVPKPVVPPETPASSSAAPSASGANPSTATAAQTPPGQSTPAAASATPVVFDSREQDIRVETQDVIAVFTNRGARLKSWRLKGHSDARREPLELVPQRVPPGKPLPFSLQVPDEAVTSTLNSALYSVSGAPSSGTVQNSPVDLKFEYRDSAGLHAIKEFHLEPSSFVVTFRPTVAVGGTGLTPVIHWGPGLGDSEPVDAWWLPGGLLFTEDDEQRLAASNVAEQPVHQGPYKFAGVDDHYFLSAVLEPGPVKVTFEPVTVPVTPDSTETARTLMAYSIEASTADKPLRFYVGPKDFDQLALIDPDLPRTINFGVFTVIVVPLLKSLKWINGYVGNYGWSILVLTAIINIIILPLRHKSVVSMRRMQEIQPEAKAIQDRYAKLKATDPAKQKMNQELMALYRERGVNPAAGCVPMLIPFPVLIAFYSLLTVATELRGQPFMLWIHDLSAPDPYYVTPILMGASQLWQQWIAPAAGVDPIQRKMMMVMPVVFTFLFLGYPAGVALYWFASNLWAIGQQYGTNYLIGPPNIRTVRPPAERRVKRAGASKTDAAAAREK